MGPATFKTSLIKIQKDDQRTRRQRTARGPDDKDHTKNQVRQPVSRWVVSNWTKLGSAHWQRPFEAQPWFWWQHFGAAPAHNSNHSSADILELRQIFRFLPSKILRIHHPCLWLMLLLTTRYFSQPSSASAIPRPPSASRICTFHPFYRTVTLQSD